MPIYSLDIIVCEVPWTNIFGGIKGHLFFETGDLNSLIESQKEANANYIEMQWARVGELLIKWINIEILKSQKKRVIVFLQKEN